MISVRIEKLRFIVDEVHLALELANQAPDQFAARTLARHVLVRAKDFVEHARQLRKPLNQAGYDTAKFHTAKEAYATYFDEYFQTARDKLGAHIQDFDFGRRIELWKDIESVKLSFFVDGAREIYTNLGQLGLPTFTQFTAPTEVSDQAVQNVLTELKRTHVARPGVEFASDPLAMTRSNTVASLNTSPIHARAGQLDLIRQWIIFQVSLIGVLSASPRLVRILKARVLTDIVSFCDCLVTRAVNPGAPQQMDGLDQLLAQLNLPNSCVTKMVTVSEFETRLDELRNIRDICGAHLEIDASQPLSTVLSGIDRLSLDDALSFYRLVEKSFKQVCRAVIFLKMYGAGTQRVYGIATNGHAAEPFGGEAPETTRFPSPPDYDDVAAYESHLRQWIDGNADEQEEARVFFYQAFQSSAEVSKLHEVEELGGGQRFHAHEWRKAHDFIATSLASAVSDDRFSSILDLIDRCGNGFPYPLAEILVRVGDTSPNQRKYAICRTLGTVRSSPHGKVDDFLKAASGRRDFSLRCEAVLALYKRFVFEEGIFRLNNRGHTNWDYETFVSGLLTARQGIERLLLSMAFAAFLSSPRAGSCAEPFATSRKELQNSIVDACRKYLPQDSSQDTLQSLVQAHDYAGVVLLLTTDTTTLLTAASDREALLNACCIDFITGPGHEQAARHLAFCYHVNKLPQHAYSVAEARALRNPDDAAAQVLAAAFLAEVHGREDDAIALIAEIRRLYKLDDKLQNSLNSAEVEAKARNLA